MTLLPIVLAVAAVAGSFEAGVARTDITPRAPIRLGGYAARQHPAPGGPAGRLWAKALAVRSGSGSRMVIVTLDLLRAPRVVVDAVAAEAQRRHGLGRSELLFNASHTHSGPLLWEDDPFPPVPPAEYEECRRYVQWLTPALVDLIGAALRDLSPASLTFARGTAGFAANRRVPAAGGYQIGYNPAGPVDHRVPVLKVTGADDRLRAVLFGYACHNTAIGPASYDVNGDYAGAAQELIEQAHPGATALFLQLAAGDQDPHPRGDRDAADRHGR
ncbi:MAG TPA: neutral/alkaline non-lysosomal ceramidase N-terminal domain-containing protein, partial [Vicinamibacterales bacterium]|nr:neutral/alkaline non-lysosomal ceramidase N-terminal domain-containing protein [Vicinamibacterales bacterium]